jgi:hypothetical protein
VRRVRALDPEKLIVIKSSVFDLVHQPLAHAQLPIIDEGIPFPEAAGSGASKPHSRERSSAGLDRASRSPPTIVAIVAGAMRDEERCEYGRREPSPLAVDLRPGCQPR